MKSGFEKLKGVTIKAISASCVNHVTLLGDDGYIYVIDAEIMNGLPVMTLKRHKELLVSKPEPVRIKIKRKKKD